MMRLLSAILGQSFGFLFFVSLVSCTGSTAPGTVSTGERVLSVLDFGSITKVRDIQKNKNHFSVHVRGKVGAQAPLMGGVRAYELKDETGSIWIVTTDQIPTQGTPIVVQGTVRLQKIEVGGQDRSAVYLEQRKVEASS
ncbi:hypothetical protein GS601_09355 [Myxacorys almedinensis A]|uniref:Uncharacterized protein n=2 Tax=Myxacorys TaxID=2056239 RepID=A0A8J7Z3F9_9CYAN|nr:hypothetical protein [Myxacorys almedinensis A]